MNERDEALQALRDAYHAHWAWLMANGVTPNVAAPVLRLSECGRYADVISLTVPEPDEESLIDWARDQLDAITILEGLGIR